MITVTERAISHINELKNQISGKPYLRIYVMEGGCSGFKYNMEFDDTITDDDVMINISNNLEVVINKKFSPYISGSELSYSDGLNGKGFEWSNPNANRTCECGKSFSA